MNLLSACRFPLRPRGTCESHNVGNHWPKSLREYQAGNVREIEVLCPRIVQFLIKIGSSEDWRTCNKPTGRNSTAIMASIFMRLHVANPRPLCDPFLHFIVLCFLRKKKIMWHFATDPMFTTDGSA